VEIFVRPNTVVYKININEPLLGSGGSGVRDIILCTGGKWTAGLGEKTGVM